jgi:hypothetical protein
MPRPSECREASFSHSLRRQLRHFAHEGKGTRLGVAVSFPLGNALIAFSSARSRRGSRVVLADGRGPETLPGNRFSEFHNAFDVLC